MKKVDTVKKVACPSLRTAIRFYRGKVWFYQTKLGYHRSPTYYPERKKYACAYKRFVMTSWRGQAKEYRKEYKKYQREHRHPKWIALDLLNGNREEWSCLMYIVSKENATMDPTLDFGHGHGNVYEAYGIPQAYPGTKMASAGPDWRTNPKTQLRWMIGYCRSRYGSLCGAAYNRRVNGTY